MSDYDSIGRNYFVLGTEKDIFLSPLSVFVKIAKSLEHEIIECHSTNILRAIGRIAHRRL